MKKYKHWAIFVALSCCLVPNAKANSTASLSGDEVQAAICIIANQGIHTVASERQKGTAKSEAKKLLDADLAKLNTSFKNQKFVKSVGDIWYRALDKVYQMPIQQHEQSKAIFVSGITEDAFMSCMNSLPTFS